MAGNVWEWTSSAAAKIIRTIQRMAGRDPLATCACCGAARSTYDADYVRCAVRYDYDPDTRNVEHRVSGGGVPRLLNSGALASGLWFGSPPDRGTDRATRWKARRAWGSPPRQPRRGLAHGSRMASASGGRLAETRSESTTPARPWNGSGYQMEGPPGLGIAAASAPAGACTW